MSLIDAIRDARVALGTLVHAFSDELHLLAHRIIGDDDWRARNEGFTRCPACGADLEGRS